MGFLTDKYRAYKDAKEKEEEGVLNSNKNNSKNKDKVQKQKQRQQQQQRISDEDLQKYTGMTRSEFDKWAESTPNVGKNQIAGSSLISGGGCNPALGMGCTVAGA